MKSPTKRIFYHLEVTRGTFDTEMPIRACYQHVTCAPPARYQHVVVPVRTCPPASLPSANAGAHKKSLVAERYQAFSEAKCLS